MRALLLAAVSLMPCPYPFLSPHDAEFNSTKPNILLVVLDDVSDRDIAYVNTPAFDGLAAGGLRFTRAYAMPTCGPARWGIRFGEWQAVPPPDPCRVGGGGSEAPPGKLSVASVAAGANYRTAIFGKWHGGRVNQWAAPWELAPNLWGYQTARAVLPANIYATECGSQYQGTSHTDWYRLDDGVGSWETTYTTHAIRDAFLAWHAALPTGINWFAEVSFQAPHRPFEVPPGMSASTPNPPDRELYELMLEDVDAALRSILAAVDLSTTVVFVVADNGTPGEALGPGQTAGRVKGTTYEEGIRVPFVVAGPCIPAGKTTDALVSVVDILPTVATIVGTDISPREFRTGCSLAAVFLDPEAGAIRQWAWTGLKRNNREDFAVVTPVWKYREAQVYGQPKTAELYDLENDPYEVVNLAGYQVYDDLIQELRSILVEHKP